MRSGPRSVWSCLWCRFTSQPAPFSLPNHQCQQRTKSTVTAEIFLTSPLVVTFPAWSVLDGRALHALIGLNYPDQPRTPTPQTLCPFVQELRADGSALPCAVLCPVTSHCQVSRCYFPSKTTWQNYLKVCVAQPLDVRTALGSAHGNRQEKDWRKAKGWMVTVSCNFTAHVFCSLDSVLQHWYKAQFF